MAITPAHDQTFTHRYMIHYLDHEPREGDPHYVDFHAYRERTKATAVCQFAAETKDPTRCDGEMELHHAHIEFALQNGVDLVLLEVRYPGVSDPTKVGAWVESADNLSWYCERHHRSIAGVHSASVSDYEAEHFIRQLIQAAKK